LPLYDTLTRVNTTHHDTSGVFRLSRTPTPRLVLYGTIGCHLCDEAAGLLRELLADRPLAGIVRDVDIADDATLMDAYALRIPVLHDSDSGRELDWPFPPAALQALLAVCVDPSAVEGVQ